MRALLVYYSFTDQARIAAELAASELRAQAIEPVLVRIDFADAAQRLQRPLPFKEQVRWGNLAEQRQTMSMVFDPPGALDARYELVLIFSNTWKFHPSVPVQSFLATPQAAAVLRDTPFAVIVVCRGFWKQNLRLVREAAEKLGGLYLAGAGFGFSGSWLSSTAQSILYVATTGASARRWGLLALPPFGLSPKAQMKLRQFTQSTISKLRQSSPGRNAQ